MIACVWKESRYLQLFVSKFLLIVPSDDDNDSCGELFTKQFITVCASVSIDKVSALSKFDFSLNKSESNTELIKMFVLFAEKSLFCIWLVFVSKN